MTDEGYYRFEINENGKLVGYKSGLEEVYSTDILTKKAAAFVASSVPTRQPFFLLLAPRAPHGPAEPASRHLTALANLSPPMQAGFNEADVSDKPVWVQALPALDEAQIVESQAYFRTRLETLLAVDDMVAAMVAALEAADALDNTYIVFSSDNGFHRGEHRIARDKGSPYEEAILVPLVVRGPGIPAGMTIDALTSQVDLAPTFAAWAGADTPGFVDGRSLVPLFAGAAPPWRRTTLVQQYADRPEESTKQPGFHALRGDDFILVEYSTGEREFYDLAWDPAELDNMVMQVDSAHIAELSARLAAMARCTGASCRAIEEAPLLSAKPVRLSAAR